jgi:NhaP-type Na+/H+ or K+/H+ antiporter
MWLNYLENIAIVLFMLSLVVMIFMVFCRDYTHFRGLDKAQDSQFIHAFTNRLYFVLTTLTTIGYGDIVPATLRCRMITVAVILVVFILVLKAFDSLIDSYNGNVQGYFAKYVDPLFGIKGAAVQGAVQGPSPVTTSSGAAHMMNPMIHV